MARGPRRIPVAEHLTRYSVAANGCWVWTGGRAADGYGRYSIGSRTDGTRTTDYAHRLFYRELVGPIPDDFHIDHLCRNRGCVNPAHLEPVTASENIRRSPLAPSSRNAAKTECVNGHPFNDANTRVATRDGRPVRSCRECGRLNMRRHREKQGHR